MKNIFYASKTGFTLVEVLIVFAIIGIVSVFYLVDMRPKTEELLKMDTTRLAADIRYIRSMTASRAVYNGVFPSDGYGIIFNNGTGPISPQTNQVKSSYKLMAGSNIIKTVNLSDVNFRLVDPNSTLQREAAINYRGDLSLYFKSENDIVAPDFGVSIDGDYQIEIYSPRSVIPVYYDLSKISIGRRTGDNFVWSNLAITYDTKGIECGNGIIEAGETCEPVVNGVPDLNCLPKAAGALGCHTNTCGDGYIMGAENCEFNPRVSWRAGISCASGYWCYTCSGLLIAAGSPPVPANGCKIIDASGNIIESASCCQGYGFPYTCQNCRRAFNCLRTCPDDDIDLPE